MSEFSKEHEMQAQSPFHLLTQPATTQDLQILASVGRHALDLSEEKSLKAARKFANWANEGAQGADAKQMAVLKILRDRVSVPMSSAGRKGQPSVWPIIPIIPGVQKLSCFTRLTGSPWNPGAFVFSMIRKGAGNAEEANRLGKLVGDKLALEEENEDVWAKELEGCMKAMGQVWDEPDSSAGSGGKKVGLPHTIDCDPFPARALCNDLEYILKLKDVLTRRQWISMLDSFLRMACATELLWVARTNTQIGKLLSSVADDPLTKLPTEDEVARQLVGDGFLLTSNLPFEPQVQKLIRDYANARIFIREFLGFLQTDQAKHYEELQNAGGLSSHKGISTIVQMALKHRKETISIRRRVFNLIDSEPLFLNLKTSKSWPAQYYFFVNGVLSQRQTKDLGKMHFDQGYWCPKPSKNAKKVFRPGPIGVLTMAHLAGAQNGGSATSNGLVSQFSRYGIRVTLDDVTQGKLGQDLRHLGLVMDSPDAEGGMLIRSPFES